MPVNPLIESLQECLMYFSCLRCGTCCREASITLTEAELLVLMKRDGPGVLDLLDPNIIQHTFKPSCYYLQDGACRCYEARPISCRTYPFMFMKISQGSVLALAQCPMGLEIRQSLEKHLYNVRRRKGISEKQYRAMQARKDQQTSIIEARAREQAKAAGHTGNLVEAVTISSQTIIPFIKFLKFQKRPSNPYKSLESEKSS